MENTMIAFIFQIFYVTPVITLLIRVISDLMANYKYLSDLDKIFHTKQFKNAASAIVTIIFPISDAMPIIRLFIRVLNTF